MEEVIEDVAAGSWLEDLPGVTHENDHMYFAGWSTTGDESGVINDLWDHDHDGYLEIKEDVTLTAIWVEGVIVTYHGNGGEFYVSEEYDEEEDDWVEIYSPTKERLCRKGSILKYYDISFDIEPERKVNAGWSLTADGTALEYDEELEGYLRLDRDLDLYAVWEDYYNVTIDLQGGYYWVPEDDSNHYDTVDIRSCDHGSDGQIWFESLRFSLYHDDQDNAIIGFSTDPEGKNIVLSRQNRTLSITGDITLYAVWEPGVVISLSECGYVDHAGGILINAFQSYWKWNEEKGAVSQTVPKNTPISDVAMPFVYHVEDDSFDDFLGWSTSTSRNDLIIGEGVDGSYIVENDVVLYPIFTFSEEPESYASVIWNANGGTIAEDGYPSLAEKQAGVGTSLRPADVPELVARSGYELLGWSSDASAAEAEFNKTSVNYTVNGPVTFYAVWKEKEKENQEDGEPTAAGQIQGLLEEAENKAASGESGGEEVQQAISDLVTAVIAEDNQEIIDSAPDDDPQLEGVSQGIDTLLQNNGYGDVSIGATVSDTQKISDDSADTVSVAVAGAGATVAEQIREDIDNNTIDPAQLGTGETITYNAKVVVANVKKEETSLDLSMDISVSVVADVPNEDEKEKEHVQLASPVTVTITLPASYKGLTFDLLHETSDGMVQLSYTSRETENGVEVTFAVPGLSPFQIANVRCRSHNFAEDKYEVYREATCTSNEVRKYFCQNEGCGGFELREIKGTMKAHEWELKEVTKEATCTEKGEAVYKCKNCSQTKTEEIPAAGHTLAKVNAKAATCTEAGNKEYYTCEKCHKLFADADGKTEITLASTVVKASGHSWDNGKVTKTATCTSAGVQTRTCSVCKKQETRTVPATGVHKAVTDAAVAATCTTAGKTAGSHCSVCGTVLTAQKVIPATGHKWDNGKITTYATTSAAGVKTYTCTVCGATKTEAIPKLTAKQAEGNAADPASVAGTEKAMTAVKDTGEPKGSSFASIQLQSKKQTKNSITLSWNKVKGAKGYIIYGNKCGSKYKLKRIGKTTKKSFVYKKLKKGTYYKFTVAAYKIVNGTEQVIAKSKMIHVATTGGKVTNVSKVTATVKKKAVTKLSLKAKKTAAIAAKQTLQNKKLKLSKHRAVKYESSNTKIAKVSAKGKVTAKKKGTCYIYVYSQTGVFAKVKVTVK